MERIQNQAAKLAKCSQITCLKHIRGGPYWDREGKRRYFQRTKAGGLLVSKASSVLEGRRCHQGLHPESHAGEGPAQPSSQGSWGRRATPNPPPVFLPKAPALPLGSPRAAHPVLVLWEAGERGCRWCSSARPRLPGDLRAASLGEMGLHHLVQLCKQVSPCFKGTFSCDFSQLKKWI